ncbi:MAG: hypothetical protein Q8S94_05535 [Pseudohongiella sp.]|nr:hypothetical protein [Pseudohongiella sp.]
MKVQKMASVGWLALVFAGLLGTTSISAQTERADPYVEWSAETRTSLGFRVNGDAVRTLLPPGWTVAANPDNPAQVSLSVTFMDRHVVLDPQGQPVGTGSSRYMVMSVQARNAAGEGSTLIINGISPEGVGSYEVYQPAVVARAERALSGSAEQSSRVQESWQMVSGSGDSVSLTLTYQQAIPVRRPSTIVIRSGKNTGFTRTYKIDQANDALGVPGAPDSRIESMSLQIEGPLYSRIFDGSEVLTGITSTPWYHREIYIP